MKVLFDGLLAGGERDEESPDYELLEAAVDGTLEPVEAELFASRLAGDPVLQREFDDLMALRDRFQTSRAAHRFASYRVAAGRAWKGLGLAAAAVLLVALGLGFRQDLQRSERAVSEVNGGTGRPAPAQSQGEPLFVDSFEGGTTDSWSN